MRIDSPSRGDLASLVAWLREAPASTTFSSDGVLELLEHLDGTPTGQLSVQAAAGGPTLPWMILLWTAPPQTRIGVSELCEAVGRPKTWIYEHTSRRGKCPRLPHRKMDGQLLFVVGEIRTWLVEHEVLGS